ncbi:MAG: hypothetical protein Q7R41_12645 [Phycisphaerales bacterium]|nr:hypothetical protein [Phycisphaerales bacterium]
MQQARRFVARCHWPLTASLRLTALMRLSRFHGQQSRVPLRGTAAQRRRAKPLRRVKGRRAIDFHEGDKIDEKALKSLIRQAVALNSSGKSKPSKKAKS